MIRTLDNFRKSKGLSLLIVDVMVIAFFYILNRNYLSTVNIRGIMYAMSLVGTITCGMACLMMSGAIDLASGAEGMCGGIAVALLLKTGMPWPVALVLVLILGACFGGINAFLVNRLNFTPFIATIAMASVWIGLDTAASNNLPIMITDKGFWSIGESSVWIFPVPFLIMAVLLIIYGTLVSRTKFGRQMLLCGGNRSAARLAGLNYKKITAYMFINNGVVSVLGGAVLAARMHSGTATNVVGSEMDGLTAAIIGGVSFLGGGSSGMFVLFLGILMLNCFKNGLYIINLNAYWQIIANGALLIIALIVDYMREHRRLKSLKGSPAHHIKL